MCKLIRAVALNQASVALMRGLLCIAVSTTSASGASSSTAPVQAVPSPFSFEEYLQRMHISGAEGPQLKLAYADYLSETCRLHDQATRIIDTVIAAATTEPWQLLWSAYDQKLRVLWAADRRQEYLATCDQFRDAFSDAPSTVTRVRIIVPIKRTVEEYSLARKSYCYERMGQLEKALEAFKASNAIGRSFLDLAPEEEARGFKLVLMNNYLRFAELYEKMGRYDDALQCLTELQDFLQAPSNRAGIADPAHPDEQSVLLLADRVRDKVLPAAMKRVQDKKKGLPSSDVE